MNWSTPQRRTCNTVDLEAVQQRFDSNNGHFDPGDVKTILAAAAKLTSTTSGSGGLRGALSATSVTDLVAAAEAGNCEALWELASRLDESHAQPWEPATRSS